MIEETLSELTSAIRALTAAVLTAGAQPSQPTAAPTADAAAPARPGRPRRTKAEMEADAAKAAAAAKPEPVAEPEQEEVAGGHDDGTAAGPTAEAEDDLFDTTPSAPAPAATLDDARSVVMRVAQFIGRDVGAKLVAHFGASKLGDVKPEQYGELVARGEALIAEHKATRAA